VKVDMSRFNFKDAATVAADLLSMAPSPQTLASIEKGVQRRSTGYTTLADTSMDQHFTRRSLAI